MSSASKRLPTGAEIAAYSGQTVTIGDKNGYNWLEKTIYLRAEVYGSNEVAAILIGAHELRHAQQPLWAHALRFLPPVRWWQEMDAWEFAAGFLASAVIAHRRANL